MTEATYPVSTLAYDSGSIGSWARRRGERLTIRGADMSGLAPVFGILAVGVAVADTIPYVRDILGGTTRPHRGTWLVWGSSLSS